MKKLTTPNDLTMLSKAWLLYGEDCIETPDQHEAMLNYIKDTYTFDSEESISEGISKFLDL